MLTWILAAHFVLGIVMNAMSGSPIERWVMTPTCVILATATIIIALAAS